MSRRADLVGSLVFAAVGLVVAVMAWTEPPTTLVYDSIGPMGFPLVLGASLFLLGSVQSISTVRRIRRSGPVGASEGTDDEPEHASSPLRGLGFIAGSFVYLAILVPLGYLLATALALFLGLTAMRYRGWAARAVLAVAFTLGGFLVFVEGLGVPLPNGVLADLLLQLGIVDYR